MIICGPLYLKTLQKFYHQNEEALLGYATSDAHPGAETERQTQVRIQTLKIGVALDPSLRPELVRIRTELGQATGNLILGDDDCAGRNVETGKNRIDG